MTASQDMIRGRSNIVTLTNNSGGALIAGDVCVQDTTGDEYATTTTSAASTLKVFVAAESIGIGATGKFYESGYCPFVNVNASVTRGRFLFTHTVAKQAAENATYGAGAFGKILKSGTSPSAIIYSQTAQISGGGVAADAIWTAKGQIAIATGSGAAVALNVGSNTQVLTADSTQTSGVKWAAGGGGASTSDHFVVGKGGEADTDISNKIIIPGLSGSPDIRVAGTNDDEFDTLSGWTTLGALDTLNVTSFQSNLYMVKNTSGNQLDGIYKACPTIPFTMTAKMTDYRFDANYTTPNIFIAEASPGKIVSWGPQFGVNIIERRNWTNRTTLGSQGTPSIGQGNLPLPLYLRIVVNASNNVDYGVSIGGLVFRLLITGLDTGFTVGSVGLGLAGYGAIPCSAIFDWVRFT